MPEKYSFEKIPTEEPKQEETMEELKTQEQFDKEIEESAEQLNISLQDLKKMIDDYGGPEEFKRKFEENSGQRKNYDDNTEFNHAGVLMHSLESKADDHKESSKSYAKMAAVTAGLTAILEGASAYGFAHEQIDAQGEWYAITAGLITGAMSLGMVFESIKQRTKSRRLEREKKIEGLKFKMTGTEVK